MLSSATVRRFTVILQLSGLAVLSTDAAAAAGIAARAAGTGFVLPVPPPPVLLTPFNPPANKYGAGHRGVDLAAAQGSTVVAAGPGTVVFAGDLAGRGVISIQHDGGLRTTYEPVAATVAAGTTVVAGQQIGVLQPGHAGCAPAVCLHWGARLADQGLPGSDVAADPWRVRLLPWAGRGS